jgi:HEAT repeat protein
MEDDSSLGLPKDLTTATFMQLWYAAVKWEVGSYRDAVLNARKEIARRGLSVLNDVKAELPYTEGLAQRAFEEYFKALGEDAHAPLAELLFHENYEIRTCAIGLISLIRLTSAIPDLHKLLKDEKLGFTVARVCAGLGDKSVTPVLRRKYEEGDEKDKLRVLGSLFALKDPDLAPFFCQECGAGLVSIRRLAQNCLVQIGKPALTAIMVNLETGNITATRCLLEALGRIGEPECIGLLIEKCNATVSSNWHIRFSSLLALQACKGKLTEAHRKTLMSLYKVETNEQCRREYSRLLSEELEWKNQEPAK